VFEKKLNIKLLNKKGYTNMVVTKKKSVKKVAKKSARKPVTSILQRAPFCRLFRKKIGVSKGRVSAQALDTAQNIAEEYIKGVFERATSYTENAKRKTLQVKDLRAAIKDTKPVVAAAAV
jgi:histone H3/H4